MKPSERFRISCEVDVGNLGPAMVRLAQIEGLVVTGSELITDVRAYAKNKPKKKRKVVVRKTFDKNASEVILTHAKRNHCKFNTRQLIKTFETQGRARNSIYATLDAMMKDKIVKRVDKGEYVLLTKATNGAANG
jgi:hypothetical protein